ncbi:MAG: OB-fold domain-containing protein [Candidatus Heimdallarchaeota archaeon]|nr:OB-fold domain-containing protein [Candidatus Heimdallarchaeota archaeon]
MSEIFKDGIPYTIERTEDLEPFWKAMQEEELKTTQCVACEFIHFPPVVTLCTRCYGKEHRWIVLDKRGVVESHTLVHLPPFGFSSKYHLVVVRLDNSEVVMIGRYLGDQPAIAVKVELKFEYIEGIGLFVFYPLNE